MKLPPNKLATNRPLRHALTNFFNLGNIRSVSWGSSGMARTSRCFVRLLSQLGGPRALVIVQRYLCDLRLADFSFARCTLAIFFFTGRATKMKHPSEVIVRDPRIRRFSSQRARELRVRSFAGALIFQAYLNWNHRPTA